MNFIILVIQAAIVEIASEIYWAEVEEAYREMEEDMRYREMERAEEDRWLMFNDYRPDYPY
ncbi:MAG: hypothetical protein ACO3YZ_03610 [Candidatus Nanopelagicaceae bacterium]